MKDFRQRVVQRRPDLSEITDLLREGKLGKAVRRARAAGFVILQEDIDATAVTMFQAGRAGELLALIGKLDIELPYDMSMLLIRAFEAGDYHTFLKQVHRLDMRVEHEVKIQEAIAAIDRTAPLEARSWRCKLGEASV